MCGSFVQGVCVNTPPLTTERRLWDRKGGGGAGTHIVPSIGVGEEDGAGF